MRIKKRIINLLFATILVLTSCTYLNVKGVDAATVPKITYNTHIQNLGWKKSVSNGQTCGTTGKSLRMEGLRVYLKSSKKSMVTYRSHVATIGWQSWVNSGTLSGTTGKSKAIEGVQIKLKGNYAKKYDIYYRLHVKNLGWLGWAKNGATAGTTGLGLRSEAIQIKLVKKNAKFKTGGKASYSRPKLTYKAHVQNKGWMSTVSDNSVAGTTGKKLRMEAVRIYLKDLKGNNGIQYRAHVSTIGWQSWVNSGSLAGTTGKAKAIEAIQIKPSSSLSSFVDVYYRVHVANYGWLGWAKNGESAGTTGGSLRAEAIQIRVVNKGGAINRGGKAYYDLTVNNTNKTLSYDANKIRQVGPQPAGSVYCSVYAMSYAKIVKGQNDYANPLKWWSNGAMWSWGGMKKANYGNQSAYFNAAYNQIKSGKPCIIHVYGSRATAGHYVTLIGYKGVTNPNNLSLSNFVIIDPGFADTVVASTRYTRAYGYDLIIF